uniref:Uncharacterized protein n=1 Tax=Anopheles culicifacies TaxID=139723 RepID=A0A182M7U9_9DIPT
MLPLLTAKPQPRQDVCVVRKAKHGPATPLSQSPPSASCSPFTTGGYYGSGQVFFPRTPANTNGGRNGARVFFQQTPAHQYSQMPQSQPTPGSATSHSSSSGVSSSLDTPSCSSGTPHYHQGHQLQPIQFNWQDDGDSSESEGSSSQTTSSSGCSPHCMGMDGAAGSSFTMPSSANLISPSSSGGTLYAAVPPHLDYMAGREQLQEFPGKIPQRKRKSRTPKPKKAGPGQTTDELYSRSFLSGPWPGRFSVLQRYERCCSIDLYTRARDSVCTCTWSQRPWIVAFCCIFCMYS